MYKDLHLKHYDYLICGTSLTESSLSAFLSRSKSTILQIDTANTYGGDCKSLNLRELERLVSDLRSNSDKDSVNKTYKCVLKESKVEEPIIEHEKFRDYTFDLNPKWIYADSKSTKELSDSHASSYIEFLTVKKIFFLYMNKFLNVPFSKSEIFISNDLELLEKQKLLNFLYAVMKLKNKNQIDVNSTTDVKKDYDLTDTTFLSDLESNLTTPANEFLDKYYNPKLKAMIMLILANQTVLEENITVDKLCDKIHKFLRSVQIYDNTPFLYPQYGASEFSQAMCRLSAVYGGIFLVNGDLTCDIHYNKEHLVNKDADVFIVEINDTKNNESFQVTTNSIIVNKEYLDDKDSQIKFNEEIKLNKEMEDKKMFKFIAFYIVKSLVPLLNDKKDIHYYRIAKGDKELNNEYGIDVLEFFPTTMNVPKFRTAIQVIIFGNGNEENEEEFVKKCQEMTERFVKVKIDKMRVEIDENYKKNVKENVKMDYGNVVIKEEEEERKRKEEEEGKKRKEEEEKKKKEEEEAKKEEEEAKKEEQPKEEEKKEEQPAEQPKEEDKKEVEKPKQIKKVNLPEIISLEPEVILKYHFLQNIPLTDYSFTPEEINEKSKIIFTKNNYFAIDCDSYFEESELIGKKFNLIAPIEQKVENKEQQEYEEAIRGEDSDNDLIDELFDEIQKEEKENEEPPKEEESKPVEEQPKPAEEQPKPEEEQKPKEEESKPKEEQSKPQEEQEKPKEEQS